MGSSGADFVLIGEAEASIVDLAGILASGDRRAIGTIDGIAYRSGEGVLVNPKRHFEHDWTPSPGPRALFNHQKYRSEGVQMPVITSRGCPGWCAFCSILMLAGRGWRARDPVKVADEIEDIVRRFGYESIDIFDDAVNVSPRG